MHGSDDIYMNAYHDFIQVFELFWPSSFKAQIAFCKAVTKRNEMFFVSFSF